LHYTRYIISYYCGPGNLTYFRSRNFKNGAFAATIPVANHHSGGTNKSKF